jgi:hypothetical protein
MAPLIIFGSLGILFLWFFLLPKKPPGATDFGIPDDSPYASRIQKDLDKFGCHLIDIRTPALGDTGPFPLVQFEGVQFEDISILGVNGFQTHLRIVNYKNSKNQICQAWVDITISRFQVSKIVWKPEVT